MKIVPLAIVALVLGSPAFAVRAAEVWECRSGGTVVVVATSFDEAIGGTIEVGGTTYKARYHLDGLDRIWGFGEFKGDKPSYLFTININKLGTYQNLARGTSDHLLCDQVGQG